VKTAEGSYSVLNPLGSDADRHGAQRSGSHVGRLDWFGPSPSTVKLLDGVFIAAQAGRLQESTVRFDPRFAYHFYDLDFCRQCEAAGLTMGTWPLSVSHASFGSWSGSWQDSCALYRQKWGE
jgi:hypothetical protein